MREPEYRLIVCSFKDCQSIPMKDGLCFTHGQCTDQITDESGHPVGVASKPKPECEWDGCANKVDNGGLLCDRHRGYSSQPIGFPPDEVIAQAHKNVSEFANNCAVNESSQLKAAKAIYEICILLEPFTAEAQGRILRAVAIFFGLDEKEE